jgi:hypothetical protein
MGGMGLISGGFLAAGVALSAVPIVIHLLFRRKAPRVDVGSLRFLKLAIRDNAHRRKVRRWLLLALRTAGVLLLGLLFARPYFAEPEIPGREREVAILIDRSASMGAGDRSRAPFGRARDAASKLLAGLPEGTAVHLAFFDESGVTPVPSGKLDDSPKAPGPSGTDFAKGVAWARDRVVQSRRKLREVHLYTDLQRSGLDHPTTDGFPEGVLVDVVDVGRSIRGNLAVVDARALRAEIRPDSPPLVSASVFNAGSFAARDVEVRLSLEGAGETLRLSEKITVDGSSRREVRFSPAIRKPGLYRGSVEVVADDELPFDDRRWLAIEARVPEAVLLVDGEPGATVYANETYFLEAALRLRLPQAGPPVTPYEPRRVAWDGGANWPSLAGTRVVLLANVPEVPSSVADTLRRFVEAGGGLVIFSGDRVGPGALGSFRQIGLLPAEVDGTIEGPLRFASWTRDHPLLGPFSEAQYGDLRSLSFLRLARLKPFEGSSVLASVNGDRPLLVERRFGKGRILQWASAADNDWGDWAVQRLYLPVIHQMMGYLTDRLPGSGPVREAPVGPDAPPGIETIAGGVIVRNSDPSESRIDRATLAEFRSTLRLPEGKARPGSEPSATAGGPAGALRPGEFWRPVAWTLLVVLVAETFLANRTHA